MLNKKVHCQNCNFRTNNVEDLISIKRTDLQAGIPKLIGDKIITYKNLPATKMYKCPKCGRGIAMKNWRENDEQDRTS